MRGRYDSSNQLNVPPPRKKSPVKVIKKKIVKPEPKIEIKKVKMVNKLC